MLKRSHTLGCSRHCTLLRSQLLLQCGRLLGSCIVYWWRLCLRKRGVRIGVRVLQLLLQRRYLAFEATRELQQSFMWSVCP